MPSSGREGWFDGLKDGLGELGRAPRYEKREKLGEGGAAVVWRAWDRELERPVALKFLRDFPKELPDVRLRFEREARVMAGLSHRNIVTLHDVAEIDGQLCLVMELVEGPPMSNLIGLHKYPMRRLVELLAQAADGVAAGHAKGIVHRDLKPANVLVTLGGEPKVGDFGLAYVSEGGTRLTESGIVLGTPVYMAPEQATGESRSFDARTDVYALGAILYEIATGRPPHVGETMQEIFASILNTDPPMPRRLNASVPRDVETIALKALEKDPSKRYANAAEFRNDLRRFLDGQPILARPPGAAARVARWLKRHRTLSAVAGLLLAGLCVALLGAWIRKRGFEREVEGTLARAKEASDSGDHAKARDLYAKVKSLVPGHPIAERMFGETDRLVQKAKQKKEAQALVEEGRLARAEWERLKSEHGRTVMRARDLAAALKPYEKGEARQEFWDCERRIEALAKDIAAQEGRETAAFTKALGLDPENVEALRGMAAFYFEMYCRSDERRNDREMRIFEDLLRIYDDGTYAARIFRTGRVRIGSSPPGAEAFLFRYEEGRDRRLMPRPCASTGQIRVPGDETAAGTTVTLECSDFNFLGTCPSSEKILPAGSYLLLLRKTGLRDTRLPFRVVGGQRHELDVRLHSEEEIGAGFIHVPAGRFAEGGDPDAYLSAAWNEEAQTGDFFLARYEVTCDEYREFVESLAAQNLRDAFPHLPRDRERSLWGIGQNGRVKYGPDIVGNQPVLGVSWNSAVAYCEWRTGRARSRGEAVTFRLPRSSEWEKAARGADGRIYPWGNHFTWCFTKGGLSRNAKPWPEPVGSFPEDESPYGVRDLAGSVAEWCEDACDLQPELRYCRGGAWLSADWVPFRAASRAAEDPANAAVSYGFRVVRVPDPK
ncbi:MAG: SUMF1/EgtB/PvdO family nonheme iron enzyme [Planctomycetes bacterium]|nr:SUMF1/EgtB/PvdO family nonheme iron enzyme [Planctomycetota bacterium]